MNAQAEVLLRGRALTRRWGGLVAVNEVSLELARGTVHAVIGTNGAGKSTFLKILSGEIEPNKGTVEISKGERLAVLKQNQFEFDN